MTTKTTMMMMMMTMNCAILALLMLMLVHQVSSNPTTYPSPRTKEHKVHNIMLYPEKHSWCKTTSIKQIVSHPGCKSIEMENNVCVGACFSFSIPRTIPETPGDDRLHYCDSCQPTSIDWTTVQMECPDNPGQLTLSKMVEQIKNCSCTAYSNGRPTATHFSSLDSRGSSGEIEEEEVDGDGNLQQEMEEEEEEEEEEEDQVAEDELIREDGELADIPNNIPKFPEIKDLVLMQKSKPLNWNDTFSEEEGALFLRPINMSLREKILKSPGHKLLLQQLENEAENSEE